MSRRILYIPGLGDRYDGVRRACLVLWRRPGVKVTLVPMRWADKTDSYDAKLERLHLAVEAARGEAVSLVGESAGGAVVIAALEKFGEQLDSAATICGMNQGAGNVGEHIYRRNPAFRQVMASADIALKRFGDAQKDKLLIIYSSADFTVRPKDTVVNGAHTYDLKVPGHLVAIFTVLLWRYRKILNFKP